MCAKFFTGSGPTGVKILILAMLLPCLSIGGAFCVELSADDPIEYDAASSHLIATGNARLITEKASIQADKMEYSAERGTALAKGNAIFISSRIFSLMDELNYDAASGVIAASNGIICVDPIIIDATRLHIERRYQKIENGTLYFGQPDDFSPNICARKFEVLNFKKVRAESIVFKVGKLPLFYMPTCVFPIAERPFWLTNSRGIQSNLGFFLRNDLYTRKNEDIVIGGLLDVYTKRGLLIGPALKIKKETDSKKIFSKSRFGFIRDGGSFKLRNPKPGQREIERDRFFLETRNIAHFFDRVDAVADLNWQSDPEIMRDFRPFWYASDPIHDSFIETTYRGDNYILSAFVRVRPNNFHDTIIKTPELRAEMLPRRIGETDAYGRAFVNYAHLRGKNKLGMRHELDKFNGYCGIYMPIPLASWLSIRPIAGVNVTEYLLNGESKNYIRVAAQVGFDIDMLFSGRSNYANELWDIHGIRHVLQPVVQYRYIPQARIKNSEVPLIETRTFDTNLPEIDLADMRNVDDISSQNLFRVGLKNLLQTSYNGYVARDLLKLDAYQDIRLRRNIDSVLGVRERTLSDMHILFGAYPIDWFGLDCRTRIDSKRLTLNEIVSSLGMRDGDVWKLSFLVHALQHSTCQYGLNFATKLNSRIQLTVALHYDARIKKFTERRFSIESMLGHSWNAEYALIIRNKASRESKYQFVVRLNLVEF
jgi:LPS-assembly protein